MSNPISDKIPVKKTHQEINQLVNTSSTHSNINESFLQLETIKNALKEVPEINTARVLYFKSELALGNYQINEEQIASKMMHAERNER